VRVLHENVRNCVYVDPRYADDLPTGDERRELGQLGEDAVERALVGVVRLL
jgi:hypothetical protein